MRFKFNRPLLCFLSTIVLLSPVPSATATELKQVLILPFTINAEKDLTYLNRGMVSMLSSRLYQQGRIEILTGKKSAPNQAAALKVATDSNADYVIFGSITVFGKSVSTDLKVLDVENETTAIAFSRAGTKKGAVISHIDQFAAQAKPLLLGSGMPPAAAAPSAPAPVPVVVAVAPKATAPTPPAVAAAPAAAKPARPPEWKSERFKKGVVSLAAGDIDQDGKIEVVMATKRDILIRRYEKDRLITVAESKGSRHLNLMGVDVLDLNKNGRPEIYVTCRLNDGELRSYVLEWTNGNLVKIADNLNWYFRAVRIPGKGDLLLGQKRGTITGGSNFASLNEPTELFLAGIYTLHWQGDKLVQDQRQELPRGMKVYGFSWGDIRGKDQEQVVMLMDNYRLRVLDRSGRKEWTSSEKFGGSAMFIEFKTGADLSEVGRYYLPQRVHLEDLDGDGKLETIVVKNRDSASNLVARIKVYKSGTVACLYWDVVALKEKWTAETAAGYVSDVAVADMDGDGARDVVFAVVGSGDLLDFDRASSYLTIKWNEAPADDKGK